MNGVEALRYGTNLVHRELLRELDGLTAEQLTYRPVEEANTIAVISWHIFRMLDRAVHNTIPKQPIPDIWTTESWAEKFGVDPDANGTGFTSENVGSFRPSPEVLRSYGEKVAASVGPAFDGLVDADLDEMPESGQPNMPKGRRLLVFTMSHLNYHLGEVRFLEGLQGMSFPL